MYLLSCVCMVCTCVCTYMHMRVSIKRETHLSSDTVCVFVCVYVCEYGWVSRGTPTYLLTLCVRVHARVHVPAYVCVCMGEYQEGNPSVFWHCVCMCVYVCVSVVWGGLLGSKLKKVCTCQWENNYWNLCSEVAGSPGRHPRSLSLENKPGTWDQLCTPPHTAAATELSCRDSQWFVLFSDCKTGQPLSKHVMLCAHTTVYRALITLELGVCDIFQEKHYKHKIRITRASYCCLQLSGAEAQCKLLHIEDLAKI